MKGIIGWLAWILTLGCMLPRTLAADDATPAPETDPREQRAKEHFLTGRALFDAGEYERAIEEFEASYELSKRPALLFNIALGHEKLGQLQPAIEALGAFLESGLRIPHRERLRMRLNKMKERLAAQREAASRREARREKEPATDSSQRSPQTGDATSIRTSGTTQASGRELTTPMIVSFAAGGVGVVMASVFGPLGLVEHGRLEDGCAPSCTDEDLGTLRLYTTLADVGLGVALVGAAVGATLWLTQDASESESGRSSVRASPWASPHGGGVQARWRF